MDDAAEKDVKQTFVEANKGRLTTILKSAEVLGRFRKPSYTVGLDENKNFTFTGDDPSILARKKVILGLTEIQMIGLLSEGTIHQASLLEKKGQLGKGPFNTSLELDQYDEAEFNGYFFTDAITGKSYEVTVGNIVAKGVADEPVQATRVSIKERDGPVRENLVIKQVQGNITVSRNVEAAEDELHTEFTKIYKGPLKAAYPGDIYDDFYIALTGDEAAIERLRQAQTNTSGELQSFVGKVLTRAKAVKAGKELGDDINLPSISQLNDAVGLLGRMMKQ